MGAMQKERIRQEGLRALRNVFDGEPTFTSIVVLLHVDPITGGCDARVGGFTERMEAEIFAETMKATYDRLKLAYAVYLNGDLYHDGGLLE